MRKCHKSCRDNKIETRQCSESHNCTAYTTRISPVNNYPTKRYVELLISSVWRPFCHRTWDKNLADEVCRASGLHSAEAAYFEVGGNGNYTCAVNLKRKTTPCADLEGCSKTNKAVAVCKGISGNEDDELIKGSSGSSTNTAVVVSLAIVSFLLCVCIVIGLVCYKRRFLAHRDHDSCGVIDSLAPETNESDSDAVTASCWEIPSKVVILQNILGSGTFGEVWKAVVSGLSGISTERMVAVKKLKPNSSDTEKETLLQEIELGKSLEGEKHPNIVNFLGCVTTSGPMMLILEYVPHGDLLGYLRKSRGMEDKYYSCPEHCEEEVTSYDLLSFAQQVASGMRFLASKKILHRDLAARNVLVGMGGICKIADFGLALIRDKYQYIYCTAIRKGRLPIKWTAPEHLFTDSQDEDVRVSEKSDVCSFGVVLYEIFTLGGVPYPGWNEWKVVYELKVNKYRMSQPEHVSDELYQIMLDCWNEDPNNRPTFGRLHEITTGFLQEKHYVDLDLSRYEPSLYTNVEDIAASMGQAVSLEFGNIQPKNDLSKDFSDDPEIDNGI